MSLSVQWGLINAEKTAIAFPVAFPSSCFAISITAVYTNQAWNYPVVAQSITRSSFVARTQSNWRADDTARYIAIGCQQWGYTTSYKKVTVNFPVAYSTQIFCLTAFHSAPGVSTLDIYANNVTLNGFAFSAAAPDSTFTSFERAYWLSIGVQTQWGTYETANASTKLITITFPVSFAVTAYSVALGHKGFSNWTNGANVNYVNKTVSDMTVYYCDGYGFSWLAIGMQQWGNAGSNNGSVDVTFPISFTKAVYQIQLTYNNNSYENPTYEIKDTKSFSYWSKYGGDKLWLAIGAQQWGVGDKYANKYSIATLPIAFSNVDYALMITNRNLSAGMYISGAALSTTQIKVWNGGYSDRYYFFAIGW